MICIERTEKENRYLDRLATTQRASKVSHMLAMPAVDSRERRLGSYLVWEVRKTRLREAKVRPLE